MINPIYKWIAALTVLLTIVGVIYGKGRLDASHKAEMTSLRLELAMAHSVIKTERGARVVDAALAAAAKARLDTLDHQITELSAYVETLEDAGSECLSSADTDRLRLIWGAD